MIMQRAFKGSVKEGARHEHSIQVEGAENVEPSQTRNQDILLALSDAVKNNLCGRGHMVIFCGFVEVLVNKSFEA